MESDTVSTGTDFLVAPGLSSRQYFSVPTTIFTISLRSPGSVVALDPKPALAAVGKEFPAKDFNLLACSIESMLIHFSFPLLLKRKKKLCGWLKGYK